MKYLMIISAVAILCAGCAANRGVNNSQGVDMFLSDAELQPYILGVDDVVSINVQMHPEMTGQFPVTPEGTVFLPIIGDVEAKGLTKEGLAEVLREKYGEYVEGLQLAVGISLYRSKKVYVLGEVQRPGIVYMKGNVLNMLDAVVEAGLPTKNAALNRVYVITPSVDEPIVRRVDMKRVMYRGEKDKNLLLNQDDILVVPATFSYSLSSYLDIILNPSRRVQELDEIYHYFENRDRYWNNQRVILETGQ